MPRICTICASPARNQIDAALIANETNRTVSLRFGLSVAAIFRHKRRHLGTRLARAQARVEARQDRADDHVIELQHMAEDDLLTQTRDLQRRVLAILERAEQSGALHTALAAIKEARGLVELLGKFDPPQNRAASIQQTIDLGRSLEAALEKIREHHRAQLAAREALEQQTAPQPKLIDGRVLDGE